MENKLVTVAIRTFEKAQILKTLLESEGIEVYIHNVNMIQPMVSAGVRVRIKESDLSKALSIIESMDVAMEEIPQKKSNKNKILVPVDFSDYSMKACDIAFHLAHSTGDTEVMLLHTYFVPIYNNIPVFDAVPYSAKDEEVLHRIIRGVTADMENLVNQIKKKMSSGILPDIDFDTILKEGVPEEEIIRFNKEYQPSLLIMGTRGKNRKEMDLIGSVTAEVIERSSIPVFAIPEDIRIEDFKNINNIAYATNFDPKDLIAFERLMQFMKPFSFKVQFIHITPNEDAWNEVKLAGIKEYFKKQYPNLETEYTLMKENDILIGLDKFINEKNIDVVSLTTHKRNLFSRLFNPSIARKMIFHAKTPMLIFHA